jgi:signal transduction histidine kinase
MKSVFTKVLLWCCGTLVFSFVAFFMISTLGMRPPEHLKRLNRMHLDEARAAYQSGGREQLAAYLGKLRSYLGEGYFLTDSAGRDLATGEDRSSLLSQAAPESGMPRRVGGNFLFAVASADNRYRLMVMLPPPIPVSSFLPYYLLVLLAVALLCWVLAVHITTPLRLLARTVDRFGRGDLPAPLNSRRRDEIGDLSRAFDQMVERIQTLLVAERRLLQDVSHELRSPLARLTYAAELARTAEDRDDCVDRMQEEIDRLADLVGSLLQVTRAEGDPASHPVERLLFDQVLEDLIEGCRMEAEVRGCGVLLKTNGPVPVCGDRELLRRAVENMLINAIRYAPAGTFVEVDLRSESGYAVVSVRDYGPGVPEPLLPKIFSPFFRADSSRDNATGGLGLGLAIAHRAVSLHHGALGAQNMSPGLKVWIKLPVAA